MRTTHTYAILELSLVAFEEIREKLTDAGYQHAFHEQRDGRIAIDMSGIAVALPKQAASPLPTSEACPK